MTADTYKAGGELDALVAEKIMGTRVRWVSALYAYSPNPDGDGSLDDMIPEMVKIPLEVFENDVIIYWAPDSDFNNYTIEQVPRYSSDISAAWDVAEKLRPEWCLTLVAHEDYFAACFSPHNEIFRSDGSHMHTGEADTAPLAICLAALRIIEKS